MIEGVGGLGSHSSRSVGRACFRVTFLEEEGEKFQPFLLTILTTVMFSNVLVLSLIPHFLLFILHIVAVMFLKMQG